MICNLVWNLGLYSNSVDTFFQINGIYPCVSLLALTVCTISIVLNVILIPSMLVQAITYRFNVPSFSCLKLLLELTKHQSDYYYTLTSPPFLSISVCLSVHCDGI